VRGYDVIIIGSGLGGLVCANLLSKKGLKVLILERQHQPGGCLQSYRRGNAMYDTGLHYVGGLAEGQPLHDIFMELGLLSLPWQKLDSDGFDRIMIADYEYRFAEGFDNFIETLAKDFPEDRDSLQRYIQLMKCTDEVWMQHTNAYDYLSGIIPNPLLLSVLSGACLKMELKRDTLPLFTYVHGNAPFIQSSWRLKGDGNMIVKKLTENFIGLGGELVCNAEVQELIEEQGAISKAICKNGQVYEARYFISDAHPSVTLSWIKESQLLKKVYRRRIDNLENTNGMFTAQLLLKPGKVPYFNYNEFLYDGLEAWDGRGYMVSCRVPEDGSAYARQIDILTPMNICECAAWTETCPMRRGEDYIRFKAHKAQQCISVAERFMPDLHEYVQEIHTSTPLTYRDYNLSPDGTAYGIRKDAAAPLLTVLSPRTSIPNLLLTGQSLMLHGLHGVTMTAMYTTKEITE
jgi:phytoene dehydrogenase-like protein